MNKKWIGAVMVALLVLALAPASLADAYSFPGVGLRLQPEDGWTVLIPDLLDEQADLLAQLGANTETLRADYAANHTIFEVYLPNGIQVSLAAVQTAQTAGWNATAYMTEGDKDFFASAYSQPPYEHAEWSQEHPGYMRYDWSLQAGGTPVSFAGLATVQQGVLYTLTAVGVADADALRAANEQILACVTFLGSTIGADAGETQTISIPDPIGDDGAVTPLALVDFWPIVYEDDTRITVRTLPEAEVLLRTATDMLRGRADAEGLCTFKVSTRRETTYDYTISSQAEGRTASEIPLTLERQLAAEAQEAAYRKNAKALDSYGYTNILGSPESYAGSPVTFRGNVNGFTDMSGFPCVLVFTENPGRGVWLKPVWVILTEAMELADGDIRTVYGDLRGDLFPYTDENGEEQQAPVVVSNSVVN